MSFGDNKLLSAFGNDDRLVMIMKQRIQLHDLEQEIKKEDDLVKKTALFDKYIDRANKVNALIMTYCADSLENANLILKSIK